MSLSLLDQLKQNEADAWDRLVRLYAPLVFHWCRRLNVPEQDITDIFRDVFYSLAKNISTFQKQKAGDTFRGWLRTITRNKVYDHFRKTGSWPQPAGGTDANYRLSQYPAEDLSDEFTEEEAAEHALFLRALDIIRAEFAERTWNAFWNVVVEGKSPTETGQLLGMTPGAVRVAKSRVLHRLRLQLGELL
jgi:RNA polymerase sigma-70 factor (ECF subfamily)